MRFCQAKYTTIFVVLKCATPYTTKTHFCVLMGHFDYVLSLHPLTQWKARFCHVKLL